MKITREEVQHVARLARLDLADTVLDTMAEQLGGILDYMETLNRVDTDGIAPTAHAVSQATPLRADERRPHLDHEAALANAPERDEESFIVPCENHQLGATRASTESFRPADRVMRQVNT
jgi:aspartyl-tRNA(Asn)/glutamyl-tRNA(Gln) amidotransferase subunit C